MKNSRFSYKYRGSKCLNCGVKLDTSDRYCHFCGQLNSSKKLSFSDFFNEFFGSVFSYDSRLYRTLNTLVFHPGKISREYIEGKRTKYANPFRFYLSISIIFFVLYSLSNPLDTNTSSTSSENELNFGNILRVSGSPNQDSLTMEELRKDALTPTKTEPEELHYISQAKIDSLSFTETFNDQADLYYTFFINNNEYSASRALEKLHHRQSFYNKWLYKKAVDFKLITSDPHSFYNYVIGKLPFTIFFFLPVFTLFIWVVYLRSNFTYMEHLIFTFHEQTMLFFLSTIALLFGMLTHTNIGSFIVMIIFPIYLYKSLRKFYQQKRFKTILKFVFLNFIFTILATFATIVVAIASFATY